MSQEHQDLNRPENQWPTFPWQDGTASWEESVVAMPKAPEPPPPSTSVRKKKKHSSLESLAAGFLYVVFVLVTSFGIATVGWNLGSDLLALDKDPYTVSITVDEGEPLSEIAEDLKFNGLINYSFLFQSFAGFTGKGERIVSGTYELSTEMDYSALLSSMSSSSKSRETVTVTIPEGFTANEVFQLLEDQGVCTVEKLVYAAEHEKFDYPFFKDIHRSGMELVEGYLFPDTYEFYKNADPVSVINRFLSNFRDRFASAHQADIVNLGYNQDAVVIIASIIEKETTGDDRAEISSVIWNRLNNPTHPDTKGYLQMDSTVQYCLEERKEHLNNADLEIDSLYNTYRYPGLPLGPICCPGAASINAALHPAGSSNYYFMLGNDGEDHFFADRGSFEAFKAQQAQLSED